MSDKLIAAQPDNPDPPFTGKLTVIWEQEKAELLQRIESLEVKLAIMQAWATQVTSRVEAEQKQEAEREAERKAEFESELDQALAAIFQGQESISADEALKRALEQADESDGFDPMHTLVTGLGNNILKIDELDARLRILEATSKTPQGD